MTVDSRNTPNRLEEEQNPQGILSKSHMSLEEKYEKIEEIWAALPYPISTTTATSMLEKTNWGSRQERLRTLDEREP